MTREKIEKALRNLRVLKTVVCSEMVDALDTAISALQEQLSLCNVKSPNTSSDMTREAAIRVLTIEKMSHSSGGLVDIALDMAISAFQEQVSRCDGNRPDTSSD